jgi:hypothetical protein
MDRIGLFSRGAVARRVPRFVAFAGMLALAAGGLTAVAVQSSSAQTANYAVAPYVDMDNSQEPLLNTAITSDGLKAYTAAFVIGEGCNEDWGDSEPVGDDTTVDPEIAQAKADGASVIISSGGADGEPLAWTCSNQSEIDQGYQAIINDYGVSWLDFDIEGAAQDNTAALALQMTAMQYLEANDPGFQFSVTLPVLPSGLTADGLNTIKAAQAAGIKIPLVNVMAMDYGAGTGTEMGQAAISAAENTLAQLKTYNSSYTYANIGITPMIGINDDGSTFTLADAQTVETWAAQNGVGRLAFWSIDRDQSCPGGNGGSAQSTCSGVSESQLQYTQTFVPFAGSGSGSPTTTTTAPPATIGAGNYEVVNENSNLCEGAASGATANGTAVEQLTCASPATASQEWQFVSVGSGIYEVLNVNGASAGESWNVTGGTGATSSGTPIQIWAYGGASNEQWEAVSLGGGYYKFIAQNSGLCLDTPGDATTVGLQLEQYTCNGTEAQAFRLVQETGTTTTTTAPTTTTTKPTTTTTKPTTTTTTTPKEAPYGGTAAAVPGIVYAANYDTGGQGIAYNVTSTNGTANSYRSDGVDLEASADTEDNTGSGVDDLGWTAAAQWFRYTVNVATAGTYTLSLRLASLDGATDGLHIDNTAGTNLSGDINVPDTGAWQTWTTVTASVTLPAGTQTLVVDQDNAGWNVHFMSFASSGTTTTTTSPSGINTSTWYEVVNENSGLCASAAGGSTANGTAVEQLACTGATSQLWQFVPVASGEYEVLNENAEAAGESWNITGGVGATASGDLLQIWAYGGTGNTNELFAADSVAGGYYEFVADNSGLCIDTPSASTASGVQLQQYTCNGTGAQEFKLVVG